MAKTNKAAKAFMQGQAVAEKKEFAWDSEVRIGGYIVSDKEDHDVKVCTLNGKTFIVDTKRVKKAKDGWTPVKNVSIPVDNFERLVEIFSDWKLEDAFASGGGKVSISVGAPEGKPKGTRKTVKSK